MNIDLKLKLKKKKKNYFRLFIRIRYFFTEPVTIVNNSIICFSKRTVVNRKMGFYNDNKF